MTVLAYSTYEIAGASVAYSGYTGQVDTVFNDSAEMDIGQLVYDELQTLPPTTDPNFGYVYVWKAAIFTDSVFLQTASMFKSNPPRYKIGHVCATTNSGVVWDDTWKFEAQVLPVFKGTFYSGQPNPGDGFPFGTIPLGESSINIWRAINIPYSFFLTPEIRASYLSFFIDKPADFLVRISYTTLLSFTSLDILQSAPLPYVVVYP